MVQEITENKGDIFDHTKAALQLAGIANGVSQMHGSLMRDTWKEHTGISPILSITNAQNSTYWADPELKLNYHCKKNDDKALVH